MAQVLEPCTFLMADRVISQGEPPLNMYFIRQGKAEITLNGTKCVAGAGEARRASARAERSERRD
jgi:hypothetical protein